MYGLENRAGGTFSASQRPLRRNAASGTARAIAGVRAPSATRRHFQRYQAPARRVPAVSALCFGQRV